jgi:SpoVK/Ycf46/Vps4 family AAA+-type ATPase
VFVVGATNAPWQLDTAFRRPGRFDRIIFVPPPDLEARADILRVMCQGKPTETIDFATIAKRTDGFSGADLKAIVDLAIDARLRDAVEQQIIKPLTTRDLTDALGKVKPSTREWFATAKNYAVYSNESGIYDDILKYLRQ